MESYSSHVLISTNVLIVILNFSNYSFYSNIIQRMSVKLSCEIVQRQIIKNLVAVAPGTTEITDFVDEILDLKK